jgi:hypothetical protein
MKKVLLGVVGVIGVALVGIVGVASTKPDVVHVERSAAFDATPADVFPYLNDLKKFGEWNPWRKLDPKQTITYSATTAGKGAWYTWKGNDDVGAGKMSIKDSVEGQKVVEDLQFLEPFESTAVVTMSVQVQGEGSKVTWAMDSQQNLMSKVAGLFMDMEGMIGKDFAEGLSNLKPLVEADAGARIEAEKVLAQEAAAAAALAVVADPAPPTP